MTLSTDMLAAFVQVAEHLSVSAAAQALGVSKSVVSKRVAQLEQAVRATLFARSTRRVALTPAGEAYLDFARNALRAVADADERLRDLRQELSGQIRITAPVSWGQHVLAPLLPAFLAQHPAIEIELLLEQGIVLDFCEDFERARAVVARARERAADTALLDRALSDNLDAASNLFLGRELMTSYGFVDDARMEAETRKIMGRLNPNFRKFNVPVSALSGGQRQSVAIARAVYFNAKILIMDEPTRGIDVNAVTPMQALTLIERWKRDL